MNGKGEYATLKRTVIILQHMEMGTAPRLYTDNTFVSQRGKSKREEA
jgi:hypothetical protein